MSTTSSGFGVGFLASSVLMQMLATSEKWRKEIVAPNASHRNCRHSGVTQYGRYTPFINMAHGALDGNGARMDSDGVDSGGSYMSCPNVEWMELNYPLLYLFRRHAQDSAGAGKFRGGAGVESAHVLHDAPEGKLRGVAYGVAAEKNSGHGIFGGYPGAPSVMVLVKNTQAEQLMNKGHAAVNVDEFGGESELLPYCNFEIAKKDVLYMRVASGGGLGDPLDRDPELIRQDLECGIVSSKRAREIYGIVIDQASGDIDVAATELLRKRMRERKKF
jgi:N-methylhydantoinase B